MFTLVSLILVIGYFFNAWNGTYVYEVLIAASIFAIAGSIEMFGQKFEETVQTSDAFKVIMNDKDIDIKKVLNKIKEVANRDGQN